MGTTDADSTVRATEHVGVDRWNGPASLEKATLGRNSSVPQSLKRVESRLIGLHEQLKGRSGLAEYVTLTEIGMYRHFEARLMAEMGWNV